MITHYSSKIQNAIQRELFQASSSIKVAMAWFTNDLLFQPLLMKLNQGVSVEIILNDDDINRNGETSIDFTEFINNGGILRWNQSNRLMHDKFCIIDERVVIFGSYNWTLKAEYNDESISIARDEPVTLEFYKKKFSSLAEQYSKDNNNTITPTDDKRVKNQQYLFEIEPHLHTYKTNGFFNVAEDGDNSIIIAYKYIDANKDKSKLTVIDYRTLKELLPFEYDEVCHYKTKEGNVWLKKNGRWALFNIRDRNFLTHHAFTDVREYNSIYIPYFIVKFNNLYGICNTKGVLTLPCEYDNINGKTGIISKNGKVGLTSKTGLVLPAIYDVIDDDGKPSRKGNKYGLISFSDVSFSRNEEGEFFKWGEIVLDFCYDEITLHFRFPWERTINNDVGIIYFLRQGNRYGLYFKKLGIFEPCVHERGDEFADPRMLDYFMSSLISKTLFKHKK